MIQTIITSMEGPRSHAVGNPANFLWGQSKTSTLENLRSLLRRRAQHHRSADFSLSSRGTTIMNAPYPEHWVNPTSLGASSFTLATFSFFGKAGPISSLNLKGTEEAQNLNIKEAFRLHLPSYFSDFSSSFFEQILILKSIRKHFLQYFFAQ